MIACNAKNGSNKYELNNNTEIIKKTQLKSKEWPNTTSYKKFKGDIYVNKQGDIAFQSYAKPECDSCPHGIVYLDAAFINLKGTTKDEDYKYIPLRQIIDTGSLKTLNLVYFKDKKRVYYVRPTQEGGVVLEVENADVNSFQAYTDSLVQYAYDKNNFYGRNEKLNKEESKGMKRE